MAKVELLTEEGKALKNQILFDVLATDVEDFVEVMFLDFDYQKIDDTPISSGSMSITQEQYATIGPYIFKKRIELKKVPVKIDNSESINLHLQREYIDIIKDLGLKHLEKSPKSDDGSYKFDITIKSDDNSIRKVVAKILNASNYIATTGRIGLAHYAISSEINTNFMLEAFTHKTFTLIEDKELDDKTIILGRKNEFSQSGVLLVINENSLSKIEYNEKGEKYVLLNYAFAVVGFYPESHFLTLNIKKEH